MENDVGLVALLVDGHQHRPAPAVGDGAGGADALKDGVQRGGDVGAGVGGGGLWRPNISKSHRRSQPCRAELPTGSGFV